MVTTTALPNQFAGTTTMPEYAAPAQVTLRPRHVPFRKDDDVLVYTRRLIRVTMDLSDESRQ